MKQVKIDVQITKNLGNYESVRLGGEWSLDEGEDQQAAVGVQTVTEQVGDISNKALLF